MSSGASRSDENERLEPTLGAIALWGIAVGLVISGEYFGWNFGWATAGTLGMLVATALVAVLYICFVFAFTELTTALPNAGGPLTFATRAFGPRIGALVGLATLIEFLFAAPAIALAIGAYLQVQLPSLGATGIALSAYAFFTLVACFGVAVAAKVELAVTLLAVGELVLFGVLVAPAFAWERFVSGGWGSASDFGIGALPGIFAALPFAVWFFLAIEGVALAAEEAKNPARTIPRAYGLGLGTLVVLAFGVMILTGGVAPASELAASNSPLPEALGRALGPGSAWVHLMVWVGLFGLVASFHGILLGYARQLFALGRGGVLPRVLSHLSGRGKTPIVAQLVGGAIGVLAILSDSWVRFEGQSLTATLVTLSVLGALVTYAASMLALLRLRKVEPELARPYKSPGYPFVPWIALLLSLVCLASVAHSQPRVTLLFVGLMVLVWVPIVLGKKRENAVTAVACEAPGE